MADDHLLCYVPDKYVSFKKAFILLMSMLFAAQRLIMLSLFVQPAQK